jgi:alpha-1,3-mannosyltransferase
MICGRDFDNLYNELKNKVATLGLESQVKFESFLSDEDLLSELNKRGVFITASEHEGFGLSVVEAMAAGLIVVCRDMIPLNSFITNNKSGFFLNFDGADQDQLTLKSLLTLSQMQSELISNRARQVASIYNWHNATQSFLKYFKEVLQ